MVAQACWVLGGEGRRGSFFSNSHVCPLADCVGIDRSPPASWLGCCCTLTVAGGGGERAVGTACGPPQTNRQGTAAAKRVSSQTAKADVYAAEEASRRESGGMLALQSTPHVRGNGGVVLRGTQQQEVAARSKLRLSWWTVNNKSMIHSRQRLIAWQRRNAASRFSCEWCRASLWGLDAHSCLVSWREQRKRSMVSTL